MGCASIQPAAENSKQTSGFIASNDKNVNELHERIKQLERENQSLKDTNMTLQNRVGQLEGRMYQKEKHEDRRQLFDLTASQKMRADSEMRGVSLAWVVNKFGDAAWEKIQAKKCGKSIRDPVTREDVWNQIIVTATRADVENRNFYELDPVVAKTDTGLGYGLTCPRDGIPGCSIVDALHSSGDSSRATIFVSWVWTYTLKQMLSAIRKWHENDNTDPDMQHHFIWWCYFCNNQYRFGAQHNSDSLAEVFGQRLLAIGRMLIVLDQLVKPKYIERAWCLYEVWMAVTEGMQDISITLSEEGEIAFRSSLEKGAFDLEKCVIVESRRATANQKADLDYIMRKMKDHHQEVDQLVKDELLNLIGSLVKTLTGRREQPLDRMKAMIQKAGFAQTQSNIFQDKDLVLVIGTTGCGKSTTINYLAGCDMTLMKQDGDVRVCVSDYSRVGIVSRIGHGHKSETADPTLIEVDGLIYCDCPGFEDRSGSDISIANLANIQHVMLLAKSLKILVVMSYHVLFATRGQGMDEMAHLLLRMFGSPDAFLEHQSKILLCITKVPKFDELGDVKTRDDILVQFNRFKSRTAPTSLPQDGRKTNGKIGERKDEHFEGEEKVLEAIHFICDRCVCYHPEERPDLSWVDRKAFLKSIKDLQSIKKDSASFFLAPNAKELQQLTKLFRSAWKQFDDALEGAQVEEAAEILTTLPKLKQSVFSSSSMAPETVEAVVEEYETKKVQKEKILQEIAKVSQGLLTKLEGSIDMIQPEVKPDLYSFVSKLHAKPDLKIELTRRPLGPAAFVKTLPNLIVLGEWDGFCVTILDLEQRGKVVCKYGRKGSGSPGVFRNVYGVAVSHDDSHVMAVDCFNRRVHVLRLSIESGATSLDVHLEHERFIGPIGRGSHGLRGILLEKAGQVERMMLTDLDANSIWVFHDVSNPSSFSEMKLTDPRGSPHTIARLPSGHLVVGDSSGVFILAENLSVVSSTKKVMDDGASVASDAFGNLAILSHEDNKLHVMNTKGETLARDDLHGISGPSTSSLRSFGAYWKAVVWDDRGRGQLVVTDGDTASVSIWRGQGIPAHQQVT